MSAGRRCGWWQNSEADDRPNGERNGWHLPDEIETAVQDEGSDPGHGAGPRGPLLPV